jgi:hypothetical protein
MMEWKRALLLPCILMLGCSSCAMDGGSRGSGISTTQGNVDSVEMAAMLTPHRGSAETLLAALRRSLWMESVASARTEFEGIVVTVEGTSATGETDANGVFSIRGDFEGQLSLLFQRADDGLSARIAVNIPAGGTLTLNNVRIDNPSGQAMAESQAVDFEGLITQIDCSGDTLTMVSTQRSPTDTDTYTVRPNTSSLEDARGDPIDCQSLQDGQQVHVTGSVNEDGTIGGGVVQQVEG